MKYDTVLFDLDGTLTDSFEGITKSVQYALHHMGIEVEDHRSLKSFVGPSLFDELHRVYPQLSDAQVEQTVAKYRERYRETGIFENRVYPGIEDLLCTLKENGASLAVASTKPQVFVEQVLQIFRIDGYFDTIFGAQMDGERSDKAQLIRLALDQLDESLTGAVMVGDRQYDAAGAQQAGVAFCGVLYGYGAEAELAAYPHVFLAHTVAELSGFLLG